MKKNILVTGGAGYIGSHMIRVLAENGYRPIVFDNLSTGHREFIPRDISFIRGDLRKEADIQKVFKKNNIFGVIHFAASLIVPESAVNPWKYYDNNVRGSFNLVKAMLDHNVTKIIFSSTATVYGEAETSFVTETSPTRPISPYGKTKLMVEQMLEDVSRTTKLRYVALRYFNVIGSHPLWRVGVKGDNVTFLVPNIMKAAAGEKEYVTICGDDFDTPDGSCIRDYVFVVDLCMGHLIALKALEKGMASQVFNIGTGKGLSVKELIRIAEEVTGQKIRVEVKRRRAGDAARSVASPKKAERVLKWRCRTDIREMLRTSWEWQKKI